MAGLQFAISDYQTLVYNELTITIHNSSHGVVKLAASKERTKTAVDLAVLLHEEEQRAQH